MTSPVRSRRRWRRALVHGPIWFVIWVAGCMLVAAFWVSQGAVTAPDWVRARLAARLEQSIGIAGLAPEIGVLRLAFRQGMVPVVEIGDIRLTGPDGMPLAELDRVEIALDGASLLSARISPATIRVAGVGLALQRQVDGRLSLSLGPGRLMVDQAPSPGGMITNLRTMLEGPALAGLDHVGLEEVALTFDDLMEDRVIMARGGTLRLDREGPALTLEMSLGAISTDSGASTSGGAALLVHSPGPGQPSQAAAELRGIVPARLAELGGSGPLSEFLGRIDAPVSLDLTGEIPDGGLVSRMRGAIRIGEGGVRMPIFADPVPIHTARADLDLDVAANRLRVQAVSLEGPDLAFAGQMAISVPLRDPDRAIAQLRLEGVRIDLPDLFEAPLDLGLVAADMRYERQSAGVEIDDIVLETGAGRVTGRARLDLAAGRMAMDFATARVAARDLVRLWPLSLARGTRRWLDAHLIDGTMRDVSAAIRIAAGAPPEIGLSFGFQDASLRPLRGLPLLTDARGRGEIAGGGFRLLIDAAGMADPLGGDMDVSRVVVGKADIRRRDSPLHVSFRAEAATGGILAMLQAPPLGQPPARKGALTPENATGRLDLSVALEVPQRPGLTPRDVAFQAEGQLIGFTSTTLLPGKTLRAGPLRLSADRATFRAAGAVDLDGHAAEVAYTRPLGPDAGPAGLVATGALTAGILETFGARLPGVSLTGAGRYTAEVTLPPGGGAPGVAITGDLAGLGLSAGIIGWSKPAAATGHAEVHGRLGPEGRLDRVSVRAPGMVLDGRVDLGGADRRRVVLDRLAVGTWLDTAADIRPGRSVALTGGMLDLRRRPAGLGTGGGGAGLPMTIAFDRLILTDTIAVTHVSGQVSGQGGHLTGRVGGTVPVDLRIAGAGRDMSLRLTAEDAGAVLRAAGILDQGRGGALDLRLVPEGAPGHYRGQMRVTDTALRNTPVVAELLSAVSIVGAVEQMAGQGITFSDVRADFHLAPGRLTIDSASAVGPSLGISLDGVAELQGGKIDLQGVISPVYFLNRIGSFMTRRGEGLVGISYRITGSAGAPQVHVNPLSILTPGFLREIFRKPTP
ncbi:MAG: AsmA-like C-terminal region-containing protein [Qingshengfaniella sp.]